MLKELTLLLSVFHNEDSTEVVDNICQFFRNAILRDKRMETVFREVGIMDIIVKIVSHLSQNYGSLPRKRASVALDFPSSLIHSYDNITDLLVLLLQNAENQISFRRDVSRDIYDCLSIEKLHKGTMKVVKVFIFTNNLGSTGL